MLRIIQPTKACSQCQIPSFAFSTHDYDVLIDLLVQSLANMKAWLARIDLKAVFIYVGEKMTIRNDFEICLHHI